MGSARHRRSTAAHPQPVRLTRDCSQVGSERAPRATGEGEGKPVPAAPGMPAPPAWPLPEAFDGNPAPARAELTGAERAPMAPAKAVEELSPGFGAVAAGVRWLVIGDVADDEARDPRPAIGPDPLFKLRGALWVNRRDSSERPSEGLRKRILWEEPDDRIPSTCAGRWSSVARRRAMTMPFRPVGHRRKRPLDMG